MQEIGFADKLTAALTLAEEVKALVVTNPQEHALAGAKVGTIRDLEKQLEAEYKAHPVIVQAAVLRDKKGELAALLEEARKTTKARMIAWEDAEESKRKAEEARLQAEAKKRAEDEALAAAAAAESEAEADAILETPVAVPVVNLPKTVAKVAGHTRRTIPKYRIVNESLIPRQYLKPDEVKIGGVIRSLKAAAQIPGVQYYEEVA